MESFNESDFYTEEEFSMAEFEKGPSGDGRKFVVIMAGALVAAAGLFVAFTPLGRTWAMNSVAVIERSFGMRQQGVAQEIAAQGNENTDAGIGGDINGGGGVAFAADASNTIVEATSDFPGTLPPPASKKSTKPKTIKKTTAKKTTSTPATSAADASWDNVGDISLESAQAAIQAAGNNSASVSLGVTMATPHAKATEYSLSVTLAGDGRGFITSTPEGIECDGTGTCLWNFPAGKKVTLHAAHDTMSSFSGWSGVCTGSAMTCTFTMSSASTANANFKAKIADASPVTGGVSASPPAAAPTSAAITPSIQIPDDSASTTPTSSLPAAPSSTPTSQLGAVNHVAISAVQIAGTASTNDFVTIINPTGATIDMSGWRLHKKSSTGSDASLKVFPAGSVIAPGGDFVWANSTDGFSDTISADIASTQTLAANNSVALFDATGVLIDAVAWGTGSGQYVEGAAYPTNPPAEQILVRKSVNGVVIDTDNNANDFELQSTH